MKALTNMADAVGHRVHETADSSCGRESFPTDLPDPVQCGCQHETRAHNRHPRFLKQFSTSALTEKGRGRSLQQLLRLIGCQLLRAQQAAGRSLHVSYRVGERAGQQRRGKQEEEELPAMT